MQSKGKKNCLPVLQDVDAIPWLPSPQLLQLPVGFPQADVPLSTVAGEGAGSPQELSDFEWELGISPQPERHTKKRLSVIIFVFKTVDIYTLHKL